MPKVKSTSTFIVRFTLELAKNLKETNFTMQSQLLYYDAKLDVQQLQQENDLVKAISSLFFRQFLYLLPTEEQVRNPSSLGTSQEFRKRMLRIRSVHTLMVKHNIVSAMQSNNDAPILPSMRKSILFDMLPVLHILYQPKLSTLLKCQLLLLMSIQLQTINTMSVQLAKQIMHSYFASWTMHNFLFKSVQLFQTLQAQKLHIAYAQMQTSEVKQKLSIPLDTLHLTDTKDSTACCNSCMSVFTLRHTLLLQYDALQTLVNHIQYLSNITNISPTLLEMLCVLHEPCKQTLVYSWAPLKHVKQLSL